MIQFLNIGALMLFSDFTLGFERKKGSLPILVGKHQDFDTLWYYDIGAKITMAMISNSIAPMVAPGVEPLVKKLLRHILDRCFKKHLRKINNLENPPAEEGKEVKDEKPQDEEPAEDLDKDPAPADEEQPPADEEQPPAEDEQDAQNEGGADGEEEKKEEEIPGEDECET